MLVILGAIINSVADSDPGIRASDLWIRILLFSSLTFKTPRKTIFLHVSIWRYTLGSSDFPRSLCFMWFWFGLEILRLVYQKAFFEILNGFYLIWAFILRKKQHPPLKELKKNFFEIGRAGYQKKRNFALISKMCRSLESRSSQKFFLRKTIFCKIFQVPKNSVFL
jgi:hypothetical protein